MAEVGELLVVARCSVSLQAYFLSAVNATARLVGILSVALHGLLFASSHHSCHLESNQATK